MRLLQLRRPQTCRDSELSAYSSVAGRSTKGNGAHSVGHVWPEGDVSFRSGTGTQISINIGAVTRSEGPGRPVRPAVRI